jgi:hypothetical protein
MTNIYEIQERAKLYFDSKTFTYLSEIMPNGFEAFHNGFIIKIGNDFLIFFDVVQQKEFPVPLDKITDLQPSAKRDMTSSQAKQIMQLYYEENKN